MKISTFIWGVIFVFGVVILLFVWKLTSGFGFLHSGASYSDRLQTTISADGKMVAVLQEKPNGSELRVRHLVTDKVWRKVPLPLLTKNIQFGLTAYELLIVFRNNETNTDVLAKLDLSQPNIPIEVIHEHHTLNFPIEVSQGKIMLRTQLIKAATGKVDYFSSTGMLLEKNKPPVPLGPIDPFAAGTPSVVDAGFFYFLDSSATRTDSHIRSYALPGGKAPVIDESFVDKTGRPRPYQTNTSSYFCDYKAVRCLRGYVTDLKASEYVYAFEVHLGQQSCLLTNVLGYFESRSITPDGNTAVFALAKELDASARSPQIVVAKFIPQQCAPVSVQQFKFEAK